MSLFRPSSDTGNSTRLRLFLAMAILVFLSLAFGAVQTQAAPRISKTSKTLRYGRSFTLKVNGTKKKVSWVSSNSKIAKVKRTGRNTAKVLAGKKYGSAIITAKAGSLSLTCTVRVSKTGKVSKVRSTVVEAGKHPVSGGKWNGKRYRDKNGWYLTNTFARIGKYYYYFGSDSRKKSGFFDVGEYTFWADAKGHLTISSTPMMSNGNCYAFDANGRMVRNREIIIGKYYYYYNNEGVQVKTQMVGNRYYGPQGNRLFDLDEEFSRPLSSKDLSSYDYLYVGASKPYALGQKVMPLDNRIYFNCSGGAKIDFFFTPHSGVEALLPVIRRFLTQHPDGIVISEMSGNDLENLPGYIAIYRAIQSRYPQARLALLDMLPGEKGVAKNETRQWFNQALHSTFGTWNPIHGGCLYGYEHLYSQPDFRTLDGTHYPDDMKRVTYEYVMRALGRPVEIEYSTLSATTELWTAINLLVPPTPPEEDDA